MKLLDKDFLKELEKKIYLSRVRIAAIGLSFLLLTIFLFFIAHFIIKGLKLAIPFDIQIIQIYPNEVLLNNFKVGIFASLFFCLPFIIYQFSKMFVDFSDRKKKLQVITYSFWTFITEVIAFLLSFFILIPSGLYILYGINFDVSLWTMSLSSFINFCLATCCLTFSTLMLFLIGFLIKNKLFFKFETLLKYKKQFLYFTFCLAFLIISPAEIVAFAMISGFIYLIYILILFLAKDKE